jgi:hypothetical protein
MATGLDGTSYTLSTGAGTEHKSVTWWEQLPVEWRQLRPQLERLLQLAGPRTTKYRRIGIS